MEEKPQNNKLSETKEDWFSNFPREIIFQFWSRMSIQTRVNFRQCKKEIYHNFKVRGEFIEKLNKIGNDDEVEEILIKERSLNQSVSYKNIQLSETLRLVIAADKSQLLDNYLTSIIKVFASKELTYCSDELSLILLATFEYYSFECFEFIVEKIKHIISDVGIVDNNFISYFDVNILVDSLCNLIKEKNSAILVPHILDRLIDLFMIKNFLSRDIPYKYLVQFITSIISVDVKKIPTNFISPKTSKKLLKGLFGYCVTWARWICLEYILKAIEKKQRDSLIKDLIIYNGKKYYPLTFSVVNGNEEIVKILLKNGANSRITDCYVKRFRCYVEPKIKEILYQASQDKNNCKDLGLENSQNEPSLSNRNY